MAITATFNPSAQVLTTFGDNLNNTMTFARNAAGTILVNGGAVAIKGGTPTVANTAKSTDRDGRAAVMVGLALRLRREKVRQPRRHA